MICLKMRKFIRICLNTGKTIAYKNIRNRKALLLEKDARNYLYKKYKRGVNLTDKFDTVLLSASVIMAGIGLTVPVMLPLEIVSIVCRCRGACVKLMSSKLMSKAQNTMRLKLLEKVS